MRRADRLFQIVQLVRGRRLSTAAFLAGRLEISLRTVYRSVADLQAQGVPIEGEAGVGYRMRAGFDLPPLMFTREEAQALVASVRVAQPRLDAALAAQAEMALSKILAVLPPTVRAAAEGLALFAVAGNTGPMAAEHLQRLAVLRRAVEARAVLQISYLDLKGERSQRRVHPLGCFHWDAAWTLAAWCELRQGFRSFRIDRIDAMQLLQEQFRAVPGQTLADLLRCVATERAAR